MSEVKNVPQGSGYGYDDSEGPESSSFVFGLNAGNVFLTKFEYTANAGKDDAPGEAMDIVFTVDGKERSARKLYPLQGFLKLIYYMGLGGISILIGKRGRCLKGIFKREIRSNYSICSYNLIIII